MSPVDLDISSFNIKCWQSNLWNIFS